MGTCTHTCIHACIQTHTHTRDTCAHACLRDTCAHACIRDTCARACIRDTCARACIRAPSPCIPRWIGDNCMYTYVCVCICMYVCMYLRVYVCMYVLCMYVCSAPCIPQLLWWQSPRMGSVPLQTPQEFYPASVGRLWAFIHEKEHVCVCVYYIEGRVCMCEFLRVYMCVCVLMIICACKGGMCVYVCVCACVYAGTVCWRFVSRAYIHVRIYTCV